MPDENLPGEEIWVRRDVPRTTGRPFLLRENLLVNTLRSFTFAVIPVAVIIQIILYKLGLNPVRTSSPLLDILGYTIVVCAPFVMISFILFVLALKTSPRCPVWLYAEQLNPERLRIYHLLKPPTSINLAESSLDTKIKFKHYTTLTITDKDSNESATLGLLIPAEHDRFMQYWNAANA